MDAPFRSRQPGHALPDERPVPSREAMALMPAFERLGLDQITVVSSAQQARHAVAQLAGVPVLGFDTESKPTFQRNETSDGPHVVQLATSRHAWVFQLHDIECRAEVAQLLASAAITKPGFGLGDDRRRIISKLGVEPQAVLELNDIFRRQGYRRDMGVRGATAVLFQQRFIKSKKASTSNWANLRLTEAQIVYAANDAYAAVCVFNALQSMPARSE